MRISDWSSYVCSSDLGLRFIDIADQIAPGDERLHQREARPVLMVKLDRPLCPLDPRHVADPGDNSGGRVQLQIGKAGGIGAQRLIAANDDRHALLAIDRKSTRLNSSH